ncbi:MAG TPA: NAD-dependent epimerase/dehydratase family protein [Candidatus Kapabacteria bacterium]|nr:NAD-dependent epimerase/dehydratase family protein [Candidatus Kapabacteria bacterium]
MKALITGGTGFIGSHLADHLHSKGYELRVMVRPSSSKRNLEHLPIGYAPGDFNSVESLAEAVAGVDVVYHVAGLTAARNREEFFRGNQLATRNLLEAVSRYNPDVKRVVHVSSQAAVGPASGPEHPADESTPPKPITAYGESKAAAEEEVRKRMHDLPLTIVRPPAVYGPRDAEILRFFAMVAKGFAPLIGFDRKLVSLVHVEDLVRGFVQAGESDRAVGETYFISSEKFYTWEEVGAVTARVFGRERARHLRVPHPVVYIAGGISGFFGRFQKKPPVFNFEKGRDITRRYWICSVEKAMQHFGYRQQMQIGPGVEQTVKWYQERGWL